MAIRRHSCCRDSHCWNVLQSPSSTRAIGSPRPTVEASDVIQNKDFFYYLYKTCTLKKIKIQQLHRPPEKAESFYGSTKEPCVRVSVTSILAAGTRHTPQGHSRGALTALSPTPPHRAPPRARASWTALKNTIVSGLSTEGLYQYTI